ncbi:MAG TPA: TIGR03790 family protein [Chthoniobacterales bacterium]|nr:TIGR03790 family protein [Chthoniobacterales bacterium]
MARITRLLIIAGCVVVGAPELTCFGDVPLSQLTVVAYNKAEPISLALAKVYAQQRGIPADHLVGLDCSIEDDVSRDDFEATIAQPLRDEFKKKNWWTLHADAEGKERVTGSTIRFVAIIKGVPLKIRPTAQTYPGDEGGSGPINAHNEASVDSELSLLAFNHHPISGLIPNPYFQSFRAIHEFPNPGILLVCRLDGPTPEIVRRMITDSIAAEKYGLWGRAYVDSSHRSAPGAEIGDKWMTDIADQLHKVGIPVVLEDTPAVFPDGFPMNDCALYYGWYAGGITGPFNQPDFRFVQGAVAAHIHSFSASTLRDANSGWTAPLIARGAAASVGNVYEPYLQLTSQLNILNDRLLHGFTLAESAYMSLQGLSWMSVVVGDPLYRPYASWFEGEGRASRAAQQWKAYHDFAVKNSSRPVAEYRALARQMAIRTKNGPMLEDLALMEVAAGNFGPATSFLQLARASYTKRDDILRAVIEQSDAFIKDKKPRSALELIRSVVRIIPDSPASALLKKLEQQALEMISPRTPAPSPSS